MANRWNVGDKVTVVRYKTVERVSTVAACGKLKVTLSDDSEWRVKDGEQWGTVSRAISSPFIRSYREGDDVAARRHQAEQAFAQIKPADVPLEVLETIVKLAKEAT